MTIDCYCDYDGPEFCTVTVRKARKAYSCCECGGRILAGEQYEYTFGKWEGTVDQHHLCRHCVDLRQWVKNNVPCLCWAYGNITEDCREAVEEAAFRAPAETVGLRFGFLRRLIARQKFNQARKNVSRETFS